MLNPKTRCKVLKLAAGLHIDALNALEEAKSRLELAKAADPSEDFQVLDAVIALREQDEEAGLSILEKPLTADAWNIRLSILINMGQAEEVLEILKAPPFTPSGGTYRVASMAAVVVGQFDRAREFSELAVKADPEGFYIRQLNASLKYLESVLPGFKEARFLGWPIPPRWEFVLSSDSISASLDQAEVEFATLLGIVNADHEDRIDLEGWRLGCLANHPSRQQEASSYAKKLLENNPRHLPALAWCIERGFQFDHASAIRALEMFVGSDQSPETIQSLVNLRVLAGDYQEAAALLDRYRDAFEKGVFAEAWRSLRIQLAATANDGVRIEEILGDETDPKLRVQLSYFVERVRAPRKGEWNALAAAALSAFEATGEPRYLFEACENSLIAGDVKLAAAHAEELVDVLKSPASLLVAAHSLLVAGRFAAALNLLSRHEALMGTGEINGRLLRVKTTCLLKRGDPMGAIAAAKDLLRKNDAFEFKWMLFATQVEGADFRGGAETARSLVADPETTGGHLIRIAQEMWMTDPNLATHAYEKALSKGFPDRFLPTVASLGYQLGQDKAASPFLQQMIAGAGKPGSQVKILQYEDLKREFQQRHDAFDRFVAAYRSGQIPLHFGFSHSGPRLLQLWFGRDGGLPTVDGPTGLIRSGIHPVRSFEIGGGELYMDVSSFIVAGEVGLLDLAEKLLAPIAVSQHLIVTLRQLAVAIAPGAPSNEVALKQILVLLQDARIATFDIAEIEAGRERELQEVTEDNGPCRTWICKRSGAVSIFSSEASSAWPTISTDGLIALLQKDEPAASALETGATRSNPNESFEVSFPENDAVIFLDHGVTHQLADSEVLTKASSRFSLRIEASEYGQFVAIDLQSRSSARNFKKARELAERVSLGIEQGIYRIVQRDEAISSVEASELNDPCSLSLADMGLSTAQGCKYVWCDDRFITSFANYETSTVVGISEILDLLRKRLLLNKEEYFGAISELRRKDYRYIPISDEEIVWAVNKAKIVKGRLAETPELKSLRTNLAACVLDTPSLREPEGGSPMEYRWFAETFQAVSGAVAELWNDDSIPETVLSAKSDYILNQLGWPLSTPLEIAEKVPDVQFKIECTAAVAASLMARGMGLDWGKNSNPELRLHRRARFFDWVASRLLIPVAEVLPEVIQALARIEGDALQNQQVNRRGVEEDVMKNVLLLTLTDLPHLVKQELKFSKGFQDWLGVKPGKVHITLGNVEFDANNFWNAVSEAVRSGQGTVCEIQGERMLLVSRFRIREPWKRLRLKFDGFSTRAAFRHDATPAAILPRLAARKYLERRPDWFDVDFQHRVKIARRITAERDPADRAARFMDYRAESQEALYLDIRVSLRARVDIEPMALAPNSLVALANNLRISDREIQQGNADLDQCATRLLEDVGLARALERFIHLPIALPDVLLDSFKSGSEEDRKAVLTRIERKTKSPLGLIQAAHLFAIASGGDDQWLARAKSLVTNAVETRESLGTWAFFHSILTWTYALLGSLDRFQGCEGRVRVLFSWLHAGRLTDLFLAAKGLDFERVEKELLNDARRFGLELGAWDTVAWEDSMHPRFAQRCPVLVAALASVLADVSEPAKNRLQLDRIFGLGPEVERDYSVAALFVERSSMRNRWNSFLSGKGHSDYRTALSEEFSALLSSADGGRTLLSVVESLARDPNQPDLWARVYIVLGDLPASDSIDQRIFEIILSPEFEQFTDLPASEWTNALLLAVNRCRTQKDDRSNARVDDLVRKYQRSLMEASKGDSPHQGAIHLMSFYVGRAMVEGDEKATYERFFGSLAAMITTWPESAAILDNSFWSWPNKWPIARQSGYWKFALARRMVG